MHHDLDLFYDIYITILEHNQLKIFSNIFFHTYENYQENKERLQKKAHERYQNLSKEENEKSNNTVVNVTKISQKMKNKSLLSIQKSILEQEKMPFYNYKKYLF